MQVIVCDDDIENLKGMIQVCHDVLPKGTEVRGFSDASMLAEALQAGMVQPALLLLDIEMPVLTGLELREQMASKLRMTDIIYVTSHEEMMEAAFGRNVIAFVRKVGNWDRLSEVLRNFEQEHQCMVDSWNHMEAEPSTCIYSQNRIVDDVEKIPLDMGERKIHLTIGTYKNLVFLDCINTILPEEELSAETDKDSEWHGFGIHNIHKIVQKYDGEFELSMEKNTADAHAVLHKNL